MTPAVSFQKVSRHFGSVKAVDAVDLDIRPGEFFAMLGPSGSGKTTCLRLIAGFEQPTAGKIEIFGERAEGVPPYRRNVNTVFQDYALFPHLNVADNVAYGLMVQGRRQGRAPARGGSGARNGQAARLRRAPARPAVRRPAPARRARPRAGQPAEGAAARRAARRARPEAARKHAGRAEGAAEVARHHLRLRHPRPGRGAVDGRPRRRLQRRQGHAGRRAGGDLQEAEFAFRRRFRRLVQRAAAGFRRPPWRRAPLGEPAARGGQDFFGARTASQPPSFPAPISAARPGSASTSTASASTRWCRPASRFRPRARPSASASRPPTSI